MMIKSSPFSIKDSNLKLGSEFLLRIDDSIYIHSVLKGLDNGVNSKPIIIFEAGKTHGVRLAEEKKMISELFSSSGSKGIFSTVFDLTPESVILDKKDLWHEVNDWAVDHVLKIKKNKLSLKSLNAIISIGKSRMLKGGMPSPFIEFHSRELEEKILTIIEEESFSYGLNLSNDLPF